MFMPNKDSWYFHLLHECQGDDAQRRMDALKKLDKQGYLHFVEPQFLLDRLNAATDYQEQSEILSLMRRLKKPLPIGALMAILADWETSPVFLRSSVAHTLAVAHAEEALDLFLQILLDQDEHPWLRESMTGDLGVSLSDAPYGFASALTRLEQFEDDIKCVLSEVTTEVGKT